MSIALPENLEKYIEALMQHGDYTEAEQVIVEALEEHQARRQGMEVTMTPELEKLLDEGSENLHLARSTDELRRNR
jgi:Arc/MetJ-type ribon-helix-helix transcriptional regulator